MPYPQLINQNVGTICETFGTMDLQFCILTSVLLIEQQEVARNFIDQLHVNWRAEFSEQRQHRRRR